MPTLLSPPWLIWAVLLAGPLLFLLAIIGASIVVGGRPGVERDQIPDQVAGLMPQILLMVQVGLALLAAYLYWRAWPGDAAAFLPAATARAVASAGIGATAGAALAFAYIFWLAPAMEYLQRTLGDYVPPGEVLSAVSGSLWAFFVANVIIAPLVEEFLYRAYAIEALTPLFGTGLAVLLSCAFFGLLHWTGGVWYMLLTGAVAGGLFAALYLWQGTLLAPYAAHLALNLIEFVYARRRAAGRPA